MGRIAIFLEALATTILLVGISQAQILRDTPPGAAGEVRFVNKLDAAIDRSLAFRGDRGRTVRIGDLFDGRRPVILTLNYSNCPQLCELQLNGLIDVLRRMERVPGGDFDVVTVSIDPAETWERAQIKKRAYIDRLGKPAAASGWHFLVGEEKNIRALADSVGYGYARDEETGEYAHPPVFMVMTPDARVSRYMQGTVFEERDMDLALIEAADGKIGNPIERVFAYCYVWDPSRGTYSLQAMRVMRVGGTIVLVLLVGFVFVLWRRDRAKRRASGEVAA